MDEERAGDPGVPALGGEGDRAAAQGPVAILPECQAFGDKAPPGRGVSPHGKFVTVGGKSVNREIELHTDHSFVRDCLQKEGVRYECMDINRLPFNERSDYRGNIGFLLDCIITRMKRGRSAVSPFYQVKYIPADPRGHGSAFVGGSAGEAILSE